MAESTVWSTHTELLAQAVDLLAVLAAEHRLRGTPPQVPRPDFITRRHRGAPTPEGRRDGFRHAIDVLKSSSRCAYVS